MSKDVIIIGAGNPHLHRAVVARCGGIQFSKRIDPTELGQPGFNVRHKVDDVIEQNGLTVSHVFIDEAADLSTPEQNKRKDEILTDLYKTGRLDGLYFGRSSKSDKNPIKHYIKSCMYKNFIAYDEELAEDCYNVLFENLCKKTGKEICDMYDESPKKLIATSLIIISLKCFAKDPRYNNPRHSFVQSIIHNSTMSGLYVDAFHNSFKDRNEVGEPGSKNVMIKNGVDKSDSIKIQLKDDSEEPSDFYKAYGFEVEDLIERLNPQQRADFYECIGKQKRGKVSATVQAKRDELFEIIKDLKNKMVN